MLPHDDRWKLFARLLHTYLTHIVELDEDRAAYWSRELTTTYDLDSMSHFDDALYRFHEETGFFDLTFRAFQLLDVAARQLCGDL